MGSGSMEAGLVSPLAVEIRSRGPTDRFTARYDEAAEVLLLESSKPRNWPYGATVDGLLTLDLAPDRLLAQVELTWPRPRWRTGSWDVRERPQVVGALHFPHLSSARLSEAPDVDAVASADRLTIVLGDWDAAQFVSLGQGIDAGIAGGVLVGFSLMLEQIG
jgi:hypothetical protein